MNQNILKLSLFATFIFVASIVFAPIKANAITFNPLNPIDPFCLFSCDDDSDSQPTVQNITNTNSNNNNNNTSNTVVNNTPGLYTSHYNNNYDNRVAYVPRGIYVPDNGIYYNNNYNNNYNNLSVSCYTTNTNINVGDSTTWIANVSGGNGSYNYNWYGTDSLSGYSSSISRTYGYSGTKTASVTVSSGGYTASANCNNSVNVNNYYNNYNNNYYSNNQLYATCSPNITYANTGSTITWRVFASGGNGYYSYSWSGTDGLSGTDSSINMYYGNPGLKSASVYVNSNGYQINVQCSSVNVTGNTVGYYYNNNYAYNTNPNDMQIACSAGRVSANVNTPVTWTVEVAPLGQNYSYSWSGTDGISGNGSSLVTSYSNTGTKSAIVTVTSQNGISKSRNCENTVYISSGIASKKTNSNVASNNKNNNLANNSNSNNSDLSAATLLSLKGVPWGWIAIIVILILFGTVIYLLMNKKKM